MATFNKFQSFVEAVAEKKHNLGSDTLMVALTNTAPSSANTVLANITEILYTNLSSRTLTTVSSVQTAGVYALTLADLILTQTVNPSAAFRYVVIYNDTAANDELIAWYDYGSSIVLAVNETLTLDFTGSALTIT